MTIISNINYVGRQLYLLSISLKNFTPPFHFSQNPNVIG